METFTVLRQDSIPVSRSFYDSVEWSQDLVLAELYTGRKKAPMQLSKVNKIEIALLKFHYLY